MATQCSSLRRDRERGATLIFFTILMAVIVIPMISLAIDGCIWDWAKAKLSAAVDAAAFAAGRSLSPGAGNFQSAAQSTAYEYFAANFPTGWLGTSVVGGQPTVTPVQNTNTKITTITVDAQATVPLHFARLIGFNTVTVSAHAQSSRRDANIVLVLDRSVSMNTNDSSGHSICKTMVSSAQTFVNYFDESADKMALVTFQTTAGVDFPTGLPPLAPMSPLKTQIQSLLGKLVCGGNTGSAQALNLAYTTIKNLNEPDALNVIVFFTDGQPNGIAADFPILSNPSTKGTKDRYGVNGAWSTLVDGVQSTCSSTLHGVIQQSSGAAPTGITEGVWSDAATAINDSSKTPTKPAGCSETKNDTSYMREDVAYIPNADFYGNSTTCPWPSADLFTKGPYGPPTTYLRPDTPIAVTHASWAAAYDQAHKIRYDKNYSILIYSIGLGDSVTDPVDQDFLRRISNDPSSLNKDYDANIPPVCSFIRRIPMRSIRRFSVSFRGFALIAMSLRGVKRRWHVLGCLQESEKRLPIAAVLKRVANDPNSDTYYDSSPTQVVPQKRSGCST
jgi:Mg-chelatase subunit ChlD